MSRHHCPKCTSMSLISELCLQIMMRWTYHSALFFSHSVIDTQSHVTLGWGLQMNLSASLLFSRPKKRKWRGVPSWSKSKLLGNVGLQTCENVVLKNGLLNYPGVALALWERCEHFIHTVELVCGYMAQLPVQSVQCFAAMSVAWLYWIHFRSRDSCIFYFGVGGKVASDKRGLKM